MSVQRCADCLYWVVAGGLRVAKCRRSALVVAVSRSALAPDPAEWCAEWVSRSSTIEPINSASGSEAL